MNYRKTLCTVQVPEDQDRPKWIYNETNLSIQHVATGLFLHCNNLGHIFPASCYGGDYQVWEKQHEVFF